MRSFGSALAWRGALAGYAGLQVLMFGACVGLFVLTVVGIPLILVTAGIALLLVSIPLTHQVARAHRWIAGRVLGEPIPSPYRPRSGPGLVMLLRDWARDPANWRDLLWLLVSMTAGFVLSVLALSLMLSFFWYAIYPFLFWVTPAGTFNDNYGFITIDTQAEAFLEWIPALIGLALGWWVSPALIKARCHIDRALLKPTRTEELETRVATLEETRAETVDHSASELRRIERDLHDGAQARLVALGMSLGLADELMANNPEEAKRLLAEARTTTTAALGDLRSVVRGIHPPVLADRGLAGAVQALALDMAIPVVVTVRLEGRPEAPIESAAYFGVAECLANIGKHSEARHAWIDLGYEDGRLRIEVGDDGRGGASLDGGTGLTGIGRRLAAFDGSMTVSSPEGGPTVVRMELPCELTASPAPTSD
ncbi:MAG TPA: sensor domain-containing protein [Nocardioidaceae bacterium]|nr:sensor domain-containing protein [Nocardioidaceae bacterium]